MIDKLLNKSPLWIDEGKFSEIVIFSKIVLKRNIKEFKFTTKANNEELEEIFNFISDKINKKYRVIDLTSLTPIDKEFLAERGIIPKECIKKNNKIGFGFNDGEKFSFIINNRDHIRLQYITPGLDLYSNYKNINEIDDTFGKFLPYAFSSEFGFITVSPEDVGTGLKAYIVMHLPGLVRFGKIKNVIEKLEEEGFIVEPFFGERMQAEGNFLQISNRITLGKKEEEIIDYLNKIVIKIIESEMDIRNSLLKNAKLQVEDKIWRAYAILKNAKLLGFDEFVNLSSAVRLGIGLNILNKVKIKTLNELLIFTQPAHIKKRLKLESNENLDEKRAMFVQEKLC